MKSGHRQYTAFCLCNLGLFEWLVMLMGLKNAPALFTRLQDIVIPPLYLAAFLKVFLDDMCVFANSIPELAVYLDCVLARLIWAGLKLAPAKCVFKFRICLFFGARHI